LNVSRTPVREAIRMLELEELIEIYPQKGIFVAGIESKKEIDNIFEVRSELEALAVRLAAVKLTDQQISQLKTYLLELKTATSQQNLDKCIEVDIAFHQIIYEAADNRWLQKVLDTLFEQVTRFRSQSFSRKGRMTEAYKEHQELFNALEKNDISLAEEIVRCHIENARKNVIKIFQEMSTQ
ncbi:MAG: GntR family transcriptional regulator, partial [Halanaerobiaceae bacterium]